MAETRRPALLSERQRIAPAHRALRPPLFAASTVHVLSLVVAFVVIVVAGRKLWFFGDEWEFIVHRHDLWTTGHHADALMLPHNEHWSTIPIVVYAALFKPFGLRSYLPYLSVVVFAHVATAALLRRLLLRLDLGPWMATGGAAVFAFLGAGAENLLWAFQIGFVGSVAFGLAHLLITDHDGPSIKADIIGALFGIGSLMCSGMAIPMLAAVGMTLLMRRRIMSLLVSVGPPLLALGMWYLIWGHRKVSGLPPAKPELATRYIWTGTTTAVDGLTQLRGAGGVILLAAFIAVAFGHHIRRAWLAWGAAFGVLVEYLLGAVGRSGLGVEQATASRYVYIAAALLTIVVGAAIRAVLPSDRSSVVRRASWLLAGLALWSVAGNLGDLVSYADSRRALVDPARRRILAAASLPDLANIDPNTQPEPKYDPDITARSLIRLAADGDLDDPVSVSDQVEAASALLVSARPDAPADGGASVSTSAGAATSSCVTGPQTVTVRAPKPAVVSITGTPGTQVAPRVTDGKGASATGAPVALSGTATGLAISTTTFAVELDLPPASALCVR